MKTTWLLIFPIHKMFTSSARNVQESRHKVVGNQNTKCSINLPVLISVITNRYKEIY